MNEHSDLKNQLNHHQYFVTQEKGREEAFSGEYCDHWLKGEYHCVVCYLCLFLSDDKYDAKTGWPSFTQAADQEVVKLQDDASHGMNRTEATCIGCGAHLGHVYHDGPKPNNLRYCINSASISFEAEKND